MISPSSSKGHNRTERTFLEINICVDMKFNMFFRMLASNHYQGYSASTPMCHRWRTPNMYFKSATTFQEICSPPPLFCAAQFYRLCILNWNSRPSLIRDRERERENSSRSELFHQPVLHLLTYLVLLLTPEMQCHWNPYLKEKNIIIKKDRTLTASLVNLFNQPK